MPICAISVSTRCSLLNGKPRSRVTPSEVCQVEKKRLCFGRCTFHQKALDVSHHSDKAS